MISHEEIKRAIEDAQASEARLRSYARTFAPFVTSGLRDLCSSQLKALKIALKDYNMHTGRWTR